MPPSERKTEVMAKAVPLRFSTIVLSTRNMFAVRTMHVNAVQTPIICCGAPRKDVEDEISSRGECTGVVHYNVYADNREESCSDEKAAHTRAHKKFIDTAYTESCTIGNAVGSISYDARSNTHQFGVCMRTHSSLG